VPLPRIIADGLAICIVGFINSEWSALTLRSEPVWLASPYAVAPAKFVIGGLPHNRLYSFMHEAFGFPPHTEILGDLTVFVNDFSRTNDKL
jgi:hypothetical protein